MRVSKCVGCKDFPCADVRHECYIVPDVEVVPEKVSIVTISEAAPANATDYCHCPWVRESLRTGDVSVSPTFCQCSAGFHKKSWDVIFGQPLRAEIVETVLKGDPWCKIAIHLPI